MDNVNDINGGKEMRPIEQVLKEDTGDDLICLIENEWCLLSREQKELLINHDNNEIADCAKRAKQRTDLK